MEAEFSSSCNQVGRKLLYQLPHVTGRLWAGLSGGAGVGIDGSRITSRLRLQGGERAQVDQNSGWYPF